MKNALKPTDRIHVCYLLSTGCKKIFWGEIICLTAESADILAEKLVTMECDSVRAVEQYQEMCVRYYE
jgi:hypothetical protein